jgi:drug/metabolite transporter (DMT)-like permease
VVSRKQAWALLALTLMWGVNWPTMKPSLQETTPLMFRASTMLLGAGWLFFYVARKGERMWPAGREWPVRRLPPVAGAAQSPHV